MKIVSFVGFADSGKSTAASILAKQDYVVMSFADAIKDCLTAIFGWPRHLLEGNTKESRIFRETTDEWWAAKLGIPNFSPRFAMKNFGTEVMRHHFNEDIWVMNVEYRLNKIGDQPVVFGDVRHPNEIELTRKYGGKLIRIKKGDDPKWFTIAKQANEGDKTALWFMKEVYQIHDSEMAWIGHEIDFTIENNGTIPELEQKIFNLKL